MSARVMIMLVLVVGCLVVGCGSDDSGTPESPPATTQTTSTAESPPATTQTTSTARPAAIVGRWDVLRTCEGMVQALEQAGLRKLAPVVVGSDYFPAESPTQLARKADVCQGAQPQKHSHFFTDDGNFGSVDQHEEQVDDAPYSVDDHTLHLSTEFGDETYRYRIADGDKLTLEPVIPARAKREALANPLDFGLAGHATAVAAGQTWKRVECGKWC